MAAEGHDEPPTAEIGVAVAPPPGVAMGVLVQPPNVTAPRIKNPTENIRSNDNSDEEAQAQTANEDEEAQPEEEEKRPLSTSGRKMQALEIEDSEGKELSQCAHKDDGMLNISDDDDLEDDDMEGLLAASADGQTGRNKKKIPRRKHKVSPLIPTPCCCAAQKIGNTTVFWPSRYRKTGWGMMGPHFFGPPCVMAILWSASSYFIRHALNKVGYITAAICLGFTLVATYYFVDCAFRDPGIVKPLDDDETVAKGERPPPPNNRWKWCDLCQAYQPPSGAHCPDCNVCVAGFDHHCAWMGCCIGKDNYKPFMRFNMTWLAYLSYAVIWVSLLGPVLFRHRRHDDGGNVEESDIFVDGAEEVDGSRWMS